MIKKTVINFNAKENNDCIHTFRVSKAREIKKGHVRSVSNGELLPLAKFVLAGNNPTSVSGSQAAVVLGSSSKRKGSEKRRREGLQEIKWGNL